MFAMCTEFDDMVQAGKESEWVKIKEKWFCKTQDCKIPGKLKIGMTIILKLFIISKFRKRDKIRVLCWFIPENIPPWRL